MAVNKKQITLLAVVVFIILLFLAGFYYYSQLKAVNYLIPGVPYYGMTGLFFLNANSSIIASSLDILNYWGDKGTGYKDLRTMFPPDLPVKMTAVKKFFEDNGYQTYLSNFTQKGKGIDEIKKYVNPESKIPVIVFQKRSADPNSPSSGSRVIIGVFDKDKKVVVQDQLFGHNYEISYSDFEKMISDKSSILAIWPSDKIKGTIAGPNYNQTYAPRTDRRNVQVPVSLKLADAAYYGSAAGNNDFAKAIPQIH